MYRSRRQRGWLSIVAVVLVLTPLIALAQIQIQLPQGWPSFSDEPRSPHPEHYGDEPRGLLEVINDWQEQVASPCGPINANGLENAWSVPEP